MPYLTSIVLWTDSKEVPRWLKKNYDVEGKYYYLDAWNHDKILDNDVRRERCIQLDYKAEDIFYFHHDKLLEYVEAYSQQMKYRSIFNPLWWELRHAARDMRRLYNWLNTVRPKYSLAWAEFYYTFDTKED